MIIAKMIDDVIAHMKKEGVVLVEMTYLSIVGSLIARFSPDMGLRQKNSLAIYCKEGN